jgi:hypothetical protein
MAGCRDEAGFVEMDIARLLAVDILLRPDIDHDTTVAKNPILRRRREDPD